MINYDLYPLNQLDNESGKRFVAVIRKSLSSDGCCLLPNFIKADELSVMRKQAKSIAHLAYPGPTEVSPYFFNYNLGADQDISSDHPLRRKGKRNLAQVAADLIPKDFLLSQLHRDSKMTGFLSAVLDRAVYRNMDPYQALNISVMNEGGCQQWHFDGGNMVTTLLLQEPEAGGEFQYAPAIRSDLDENFDEVKSVLDGDLSRVKTHRLQAGTLSLFRGHYSLHRVTEVQGQQQRIQAILGYTTMSNYFGKKESSILHYGPRVAEIEANTPRYPI